MVNNRRNIIFQLFFFFFCQLSKWTEKNVLFIEGREEWLNWEHLLPWATTLKENTCVYLYIYICNCFWKSNILPFSPYPLSCFLILVRLLYLIFSRSWRESRATHKLFWSQERKNPLKITTFAKTEMYHFII